MVYYIDADVLIRAKNHHYGFALCPGFWEWLRTANQGTLVYSVEAVRRDLVERFGGEDELKEWAKSRGVAFFLPPADSELFSLQAISELVRTRYQESAVSDFLQASDSWLIAQAKASHGIVVTHEQPAPNSKRIKIPDVCANLTPPVQCISPFEMLEREGARFVLSSTTP